MRRHLHFSADEWNALPWWQARLYLEGLEDEMRQAQGASNDDKSGDLASVAGLGVKVRTVS